MIAKNRLVHWLGERPANIPRRWVSILIWVILVVTPTMTLIAFNQTWQTREVDKCEQRVATRDDTRGIWLTVIHYLDSAGASHRFVVGLTEQVENAYPALTVAECLAATG